MMNDITFTSTLDKTDQKYVEILPAGFKPTASHDVLLALHGHGSDRWQFARDERPECKSARDVAAAHAMIFISPDYRAATSWMGPAAEADVVQIITDLKRKYNVGKVFLCGGSMGGAACLAFAVLHPDLVAGVASMNGTANFVEYANFQDAISASFGGSKEQVPDEYRKRSAELSPQRLTMPVGLAVSGKDTQVPPQSVLRLAKALEGNNPNVLLIHREDRGHDTSYEDGKKIIEFVVEKAKRGIKTAE